MKKRNVKIILRDVIKNKGGCFYPTTFCDHCLISATCPQVEDKVFVEDQKVFFGMTKEEYLEETYRIAVNTFVDKFGQEDLIEVLM